MIVWFYDQNNMSAICKNQFTKKKKKIKLQKQFVTLIGPAHFDSF